MNPLTTPEKQHHVSSKEPINHFSFQESGSPNAQNGEPIYLAAQAPGLLEKPVAWLQGVWRSQSLGLKAFISIFGMVLLPFVLIFFAGESITNHPRILLALGGFIAAIAAYCATYFISKTKLPILNAAETINRLGKGQFEFPYQDFVNDEVGILNQQLNELSKELNQTRTVQEQSARHRE